MNDLGWYRKKQQLLYHLKTKYTDKFEFDDRMRAIYRLQNWARCYVVFSVQNLSEDQLVTVPGLFLMRFVMTEKNLDKPIDDTPIPEPPRPGPSKKRPRSESIEEQSLREYNERLDEDMKRALEESKQVTENSLEAAILMSMGIQDERPVEVYEDPELEWAIRQSLENVLLQKKVGVAVDLRMFGRDPKQAIYIDDTPFYLDKEQIRRVTKGWNKVNPDTDTGTIYKSKNEYWKAVALDTTL